MRTHYLPRHYLRGFCDPKTPDRIVRYDMQTGRILHAKSTKNVALEHDFYDDKTELFMAEEVERPANRILNKIRRFEYITPDEKRKLSVYLAVAFARGPKGKELAAALTPGVIRHTVDGWKAHLIKAKDDDETQAEFVDRRLLEAKDLPREYEPEMARDLWLRTIPLVPGGHLKDVLEGMTWRFAVCEREPGFLTGDNPMCFPPDIGINHVHSEVTFPISTRVALWATWRSDIADEYFQVSSQALAEINERTVGNATRYVFYLREEPWVSELIKQRPHIWKRIV